MPITSKSQSLSTKNVALTSCFAAMYVVFSFWNIFPVIGADNKFISAATITAPLIGIILGPIYGVLSITLGGIASAFLSPSGFFGPLSFLPHAAAAFASGILITGKRILCIVLYFLLFLIYAFFPLNGPAWLWPLMLWFDLIGLIIVSSPLQIRAIKYLNGTTSSLHLGLGVCVTCLSATLFGHVTGNIMFEAMKIFYLPMNIDGWRTTWQALTFLYPIERIMIVAVVTIVGTTLIKTLKSMA
jgi:hypothetical protein